jgi:predicted TIM-barrel enzyme
VVAYLQLPAAPRAVAHARAASALAPGGVLLVVAHDSANLSGGVGGPSDRYLTDTVTLVRDVIEIETALCTGTPITTRASAAGC